MELSSFELVCRAFGAPVRQELPQVGEVSEDIVDAKFSNVEVLFNLTGKSTAGEPRWMYLLIFGDELARMFQAMRQGKNFTPAEFAIEVAWGSDEPPQWLKHAMARQYYTVDM